MAKKSRSGDVESRKARMELQRREITERLRCIKNKILVMSGKGGVGKSSVAAYLSVALVKKGDVKNQIEFIEKLFELAA
jgi:Mrp family chromosome partitioning ATPase